VIKERSYYMPGLGTLANVAAIMAGACIGLFLKRGFPPRWQETIMQGIALCIVIIGAQMALASKNIILVIVSLVVGSLVGEYTDIDGHLHHFGDWVERKLMRANPQSGEPSGSIGEAFISTSLIYCVGAMAIVGSIQDGLTADHSVLYAKATLDGLTAIVFSANMGVGVGLSALPVLLYQGSITLLAGALHSVMTQSLVTEVSATGGILIMAIGVNMLKLLEIRIANMIPSILAAAVLAKLVM